MENLEKYGKILETDYDVCTNKKPSITFVCEFAKITINALGDCCSKSWFKINDSIETVVESAIVKIEENYSGTFQEETDSVFKTSIVSVHLSNATIFNFEMINASNGYYVGYIDVDVKSNLDEYEKCGKINNVSEFLNTIKIKCERKTVIITFSNSEKLSNYAQSINKYVGCNIFTIKENYDGVTVIFDNNDRYNIIDDDVSVTLIDNFVK